MLVVKVVVSVLVMLEVADVVWDDVTLVVGVDDGDVETDDVTDEVAVVVTEVVVVGEVD